MLYAHIPQNAQIKVNFPRKKMHSFSNKIMKIRKKKIKTQIISKKKYQKSQAMAF